MPPPIPEPPDAAGLPVPGVADAAASEQPGEPALPPVALAVIAAGLAFWAVPYLARPLAQDHGIFAWVGDVIREGGMPYRDAWDIKGPAVYLAFAVIGAVTAGSGIGLRAADILVMGIGALLLYRVGRWTLPRPAAAAAVLLGFLWYASLTYENTAQPDGWAAIALLAVFALLGPTGLPTRRRAVVQGFLIGLCCLVKPTYALAAAIVPTAILARPAESNQKWSRLAVFVVGIAAPVVAALLWLVAGNAMGAFVDVHLRYTGSTYTGDWGPLVGLGRVFPELVESPALAVATVAAVAGLFFITREHREIAPPYWVWLVSALLVVALGGKFFPYHWLPLYPPLALLAVSGVVGLVRLVQRGPARPLVLAAPLVAAVVVLGGRSALRAGSEAAGWWVTIHRPVRRASYERARFGDDGRHGGSLVAVAAYLGAHTRLGDRLQVFGQDAGVYHLSKRFPPTRFGISQPVLSGGEGNAFRARYRTEFLAGVKAGPPVYVTAREAALCTEAIARGLLDCLEGFPEFARLVDSLYRPEVRIGQWTLYRRTQGSVSDGDGGVR